MHLLFAGEMLIPQNASFRIFGKFRKNKLRKILGYVSRIPFIFDELVRQKVIETKNAPDFQTQKRKTKFSTYRQFIKKSADFP